MAAYAQFGYGGYPSASQLLSTNAAAQATLAAGDATTATNAPALSPTTDCRNNVAGSAELSSETLSPDVVTTSNSAGTAAGLSNATSAVGSLTALEGAALGHHVPATGGSCCENGRPIMTDPVSGQTVCSCQYDTARLALSSYSRLPAASVGVYGTPYPSTEQNPYQSIGVDSSAFYSPLSNPYALKDTATGTEMTAWTSAGLQPTTGYYSYDPMSAYGYGASYDLAARRKNATRESTATLKAWLNEHKKNPYPTKGEKIMLAIITKMTLTQVSTWFANARRRLKKENKMTWEPKNRTDDDDDALVSDDEKEKDDMDNEKPTHVAPMHAGSVGGSMTNDSRKEQVKDDDDLADEDQKSVNHATELRSSYVSNNFHNATMGNHPHGYHPYHHQHQAYYQHQQAMLAASYHTANSMNKLESSDPKNQLSRDCGVPIPATKPKIWSLADTVACKTPPPPTAAYMGQQQQQPHQQQQQQPHQQQHQLHPMQQQRRLQHINGSPHLLTEQTTIQQQHPTEQMQQSHHMMNDYVATPYSRVPTTAYGGFLGATTQQLHTTNNIHYNNSTANITSINSNNNNSTTNNNSSSTNHNNQHSQHHTGTLTPTIPITTNPLAAHQQQQAIMRSLHNPHAANQQGMGFPEVQPDTPPQTPPNMKVQSVATNLLLSASQAPTIGTCRSSNAINNLNQYPVNYAKRFGEYSPRDDSSSASSCSSGSSQMPQGEASFKPLFNSHQMSVASFVPPV